MDIVILSLFHNEKHLYERYINGLYGDSGFRLADRGYILNRNNDSEQSQFLKSNTPNNFKIIDRNYDFFRFDLSRNDLYYMALEHEAKKVREEPILLMMPSIDHFTTSISWKLWAGLNAEKLKDDCGYAVTTDYIDKYKIEGTDGVPDPIKVFKKKNFDLFENFPVCDDYVSTVEFKPCYSTDYDNRCSQFIHCHYVSNNPNHVNGLFRNHLYYLLVKEIEEMIDNKTIIAPCYETLIFTVLPHITKLFVSQSRVLTVSFYKKLFNLYLKLRNYGKTYISKSDMADFDRTLTFNIYIIYKMILKKENQLYKIKKDTENRIINMCNDFDNKDYYDFYTCYF